MADLRSDMQQVKGFVTGTSFALYTFTLNTLLHHHQEQARMEIIHWISPHGTFEAAYNESLAKHTEGTEAWITTNEVFLRWRDDPASKVLWCYGIRK